MGSKVCAVQLLETVADVRLSEKKAITLAGDGLFFHLNLNVIGFFWA